MQSKIETIRRLKKEKNVVILAHFYQSPEVQDIADYLGDSLALARQAQNTDASIILFCGVYFMAEVAKILNPNKKVLIPDLKAGCSLADSANVCAFKKWVDSHPTYTIISYINCSSEVKALSDIICTSSNAVQMVSSVPKNKKICFAPDANLAAYVQKETGRELEIWEGACHVHRAFDEKALQQLKEKYPKAQVLAHPECGEPFLESADFIGSTGQLLAYAQSEKHVQTFIILTESGILHEMIKRMPDKQFIAVPNKQGDTSNVCEFMRLSTLDKIIEALETEQPEIIMDEALRIKALMPLEKMLELS